jgi:acyl-CoA reductase-like NAD-dependent aldehyde dehydrogenase
VALVVVDDDAEAVEAMADTSYGLTAGVYTVRARSTRTCVCAD